MTSLTVSELTRHIKDALEAAFPPLWVEGEIADLKASSAGHLYFALKDPQAQIRAVMFKRQASRLPFRPAAGMQVLAFGRVSVYEPRGDYQIVVEELQPRGLGAIREAIERLRRALEAEGLFDASRKRPLPRYPRVVGVVTSPTGAAIHDILKVLREREAPVRVVLSPAQVQGTEAPRSLVTALRLLVEDGQAEVAIVGRGGGGFEDLLAFSDEAVVRAVAACPIPTVSAVGHEIDVALTDLAADARAATPTAAAHLVSPALRDLLDELDGLLGRMAESAASSLASARGRLDALGLRLVHPRHQLERGRLRVDDLAFRLQRLTAHRLLVARARLGRLGGMLGTLGPLAVLERGYAIVRKGDGKVVRDPAQVSAGEGLCVTVAGGGFGVKKID